MKIQVWVVRSSACGNGNDDPGVVLSVHRTEKEAESQCSNNEQNYYHEDVEGPFGLDLGPVCVYESGVARTVRIVEECDGPYMEVTGHRHRVLTERTGPHTILS